MVLWLVVLIHFVFSASALGEQQRAPRSHTTSAATVNLSQPPVACNDYCYERGYPPNSGQQHGVPPACGDSTCVGGNRPCDSNYWGGRLSPLCVDNFDPACWGRGASCCCGTGYALCPSNATNRIALICPNVAGTIGVVDCVNGGTFTDNPPSVTCTNPDEYDTFLGIFRDGTCTLDPAEYDCNNFPSPAPSAGECTISSQGDCDVACEQQSPYFQSPTAPNPWAFSAFWTEPSSCECYVPQGFQAWQKLMLSTYGCTTTITTTTKKKTTLPVSTMVPRTTTTPSPSPTAQSQLPIIIGVSAGFVVLVGVAVLVACCRRKRMAEGQHLREPLQPAT